MSVALLVETAQGDVVAVRFLDRAAARAWEELHEAEVTVRGCVEVVHPRAALSLAGADVAMPTRRAIR